MKFSKKSTKDILELQKKIKPCIHCIVGYSSLSDLDYAILLYNGQSMLTSSVDESSEISMSCDGLLLNFDNLDNNKITAIEKSLKVARRKNSSVLLDIDGLDISVYRRNTVISFLNRYNIDLVKGSSSEIESLIKFQKRYDDFDEDNIKGEYRQFAKNNKTILIVCSDKYYITDGYSEFYVNNGESNILKLKSLKLILSGLISVSTSIFKKKEEKVQGALIAVLTYAISEELAYKEFLKFNQRTLIKRYILEFISKINEDILINNANISYEFKR